MTQQDVVEGIIIVMLFSGIVYALAAKFIAVNTFIDGDE